MFEILLILIKILTFPGKAFYAERTLILCLACPLPVNPDVVRFWKELLVVQASSAISGGPYCMINPASLRLRWYVLKTNSIDFKHIDKSNVGQRGVGKPTISDFAKYFEKRFPFRFPQ
jgi:hypothetical protein